MRAVDIIRKKRDGHALSAAEIDAFVAGVTHRHWPDYQASALLMAIVLRGMDETETAELAGAMVRSGQRLDWSDLGPAVDKHSTGGVGDKTSLILAPIAAACGAIVPMMSGRGLGHTGGTLDKLESIPGYRISLTIDEVRHAMRRVGCAIIGQTAEIAPADAALYALRDVTATVESIPLICASIMSKKIAEGIDALVMDVKCGQGAFMKTPEQARALARSLIAIGKAQGVQTEAMLTNMDHPLGEAVGNALEVRESIDVLRGTGSPELRSLSLALAARMLHLIGIDDAEKKAEAALDSGRALEKFRAMIEHQGGDPKVMDDHRLLPSAPHRHTIRADRSGHFHGWHAERVGQAAVALGAGRDRAEDAVDPGVGIMVPAKRGHQVKAGDVLLEIHHRDPAKLARALELLAGACPIADEPPAAIAPISEVLT